MTTQTLQPISEAEADAKILALTEELEAMGHAIDADARFRLRKIDSGMEDLQHTINVVRYEIGKEMAKANDMIAKTQKNIILPSDMDSN